VLEVPAGDGTWMIRATQSVAGGGAARLSVAGRQIVTNGVSPADGLRLFSTRPVTVAQITSDDADQHAQSSGGTMVLPTHALGMHHRVMTYKQYTTSATVSAAGASAGAGRLLIVGSVPKTTVNITLSRSAATAVTGIDAMDASAPFQFTVGDGDVYQAWTGANLQDLAGTEITSDQPIAVFSGNIVTAYGKTNEGVHSPDMAHEQMPPIADWSLKYVAASLPPQAGTCDTLLGQSGASVWRLLAAMDQTNVTFEVPTGTPPGAITMGAGETFDMIATGDFVVTATAPLLLTQGIDCEPSLSLGVPVDQLLDDLTFAVLPWFDQVAAVVRKAGKPITLDGVPIPESLFAAAGGGYEVARVSIPTCDASERVCAHRLQGSFGLTLRGMDVLSSYALTMPTWIGCHDVDLTCPQ
jgi:hypothetical protein